MHIAAARLRNTGHHPCRVTIIFTPAMVENTVHIRTLTTSLATTATHWSCRGSLLVPVAIGFLTLYRPGHDIVCASVLTPLHPVATGLQYHEHFKNSSNQTRRDKHKYSWNEHQHLAVPNKFGKWSCNALDQSIITFTLLRCCDNSVYMFCLSCTLFYFLIWDCLKCALVLCVNSSRHSRVYVLWLMVWLVRGSNTWIVWILDDDWIPSLFSHNLSPLLQLRWVK